MCGRNIRSPQRLAWALLLLFSLAALLSERIWGEGIPTSQPLNQNMTPLPGSSTLSSMTPLEIWPLLNQELIEWEQDWSRYQELSKKSREPLPDLQKQVTNLTLLVSDVMSDNEELQSSAKHLTQHFNAIKDLMIRKDRAHTVIVQGLQAEIERLELRLKITGGVTITVTVAGIIGWVLWAVK